MNDSQQDKLDRINQLVAAGEVARARVLAGKMAWRKFSRKDFPEVIETLRKLNLYSLVLRVLNPVVIARPRQAVNPTDLEKTYYAGALVRIGASDEALRILGTVKGVAEADLFKANALFTKWNYDQAISLLEKYLKHPDLSTYQRAVGNVNLAAALTHEERFGMADDVLNLAREITKQEGLSVLYGNTLEISAQNEINQSRWRRAEEFLNEAHALLNTVGGLDKLFVEKWRFYLDWHRAADRATLLTRWTALRAKASAMEHWESVRDLDRIRAMGLSDSTLLRHVYFGTPHQAFRDWIRKRSPENSFHDESHRVDVSPFGITPSRGVRIVTRVEGKEGHLVDQYLHLLVSDFYRPWRIASLFERLFPDEYFNPVTSPQRIHQITKRLRETFRSAKLPLQIVEHKGTYRLEASHEITIAVPHPEKQLPLRWAGLSQLQAFPVGELFSAGEGAKVLNLPRRTAVRYLQRGVEEGSLFRVGNGPATRYRRR